MSHDSGGLPARNEGARDDRRIAVPVSGGREVSGAAEVTRRGKDGDSSHRHRAPCPHTLVNLQSHQKQSELWHRSRFWPWHRAGSELMDGTCSGKSCRKTGRIRCCWHRGHGGTGAGAFLAKTGKAAAPGALR